MACGGDSEGSDEDWVAAVCKGFENFAANIEDAQEEAANLDPGGDVEEEAAKLLADPIAQLAKDIDKANPPADLKQSHDQLVSALETAAAALKDGNFGILDEIGDTLGNFEPPQAIRDRISAVAENTASCSDIGIFGS